MAIKITRKYHALKGNRKKIKIGVLTSSYHGSYYGSLSASQFESKYKNGYGPFVEDFISFDLPFCRCCKVEKISSSCLKKMLDKLKEQFHGEELAGIMIEPIIGSGGIIPLPTTFLKELERLCHSNDVLFICDEVATGFGRTGKMFAFQWDNLKPDIVCMAKGINSGYLPMGAVAIQEKICKPFIDKDIPIFHLSTQNGNPVCCSAALETIRQLEEEDKSMIYHVERMGCLLKSELWKAIGEHPYVQDIRGKGLMLAIDLVESKTTREQLTQEHLLLLVERFKRLGILAEFCYNERVTTTVTLFFAFVISEEEIKMVITKIDKIFQHFV